MLGVGVVILSPSLVISTAEVDKLVGILRDGLVSTAAEMDAEIVATGR